MIEGLKGEDSAGTESSKDGRSEAAGGGGEGANGGGDGKGEGGGLVSLTTDVAREALEDMLAAVDAMPSHNSQGLWLRGYT